MKTLSARKLVPALSLVVGLGAAAPFALAQTASSGSPSAGGAEPVPLEKFEVTGSRIKRLDIETPSPVVRLDAAALEATGFSDFGEILRSLPLNTSYALVPEGSGVGITPGVSTFNFRGLGNNNTLFLLNGRRVAPVGAGAFDGFQSVVDLKSIPTAAIESVEILKDGASAIYGSDAVAGVVNVKLRTNYQGVSAKVRFGNTVDTDSFYRSASVVAGASRGRTQITVVADAMSRNAIANRDLDFNKNDTADKRANPAGTSSFELSEDGSHYTGIDWRSSNTFPARFFIPGTNTIRTFAAPTTDPSPTTARASSRATGVGYYDFQKDSWALPEESVIGASAYVRHEFSEALYGFAELAYRHANEVIASAPAPFMTTDQGAGQNHRLIVPKESPYNPYGERYFPGSGRDILLNTYRVMQGGNRYPDIVSEYPRVVAGVGGQLGQDWSWESYYMWTQSSYVNKARGTAFDSRVQAAFMGLSIDGQTLYANPFGPEDPRVTAYYIGDNRTKAIFVNDTFSLGASGTLFDLPTGAVSLATGVETRHEEVNDRRTRANETGDVVGGYEALSYSTDRTVHAAYAELSIPVYRRLEFQLAGRFEDYSDFGSTAKPKVGVKVRATDWLLLRGSFARSFKAPDLAYVHSKGRVTFTSNLVADPKRPDTSPTELKTVGRGNPDLQPEETNSYYVGAVFAFENGPLKNFTFEVGGFRYEQKNLITSDTGEFTLRNEDRLPAGRVVRQPLTPEEIAGGITAGRLEYVANDWYNSNSATLEGLDFATAYTVPWERFGQFRLGASATYESCRERKNVNSLGVLSRIDLDDTYSYPMWRGNATLDWKLKHWSAAVYVSYIGDYPNPFYPSINPFVTVNPRISYDGWLDTKITLGARNVLNNHPPLDLVRGNDSYAAGVHSPEPAFFYLELEKKF